MKSQSKNRVVNDELMRPCSKCGECKPATLEFFPPKYEGGTRIALGGKCRVCKNKQVSEATKRNPDYKARKRARKQQKRKTNANERWGKLLTGARKRDRDNGREPGEMRPRDLGVIYERQERLCALCQMPLAALESSIDRVDNSRGYTLDNIALLHMGCNAVKSAHTPETALLLNSMFMRYFPGFRERLIALALTSMDGRRSR